MKFGIYGLHRGDNVDPATLARRARAAEAAGFESLWVGDHIALPTDAPDPADEPRLEAVVALAHLAATTSTIRLAFGVIVLPQRQPVLLAKQIASVDVLSGGRLIVGLGVGYVEAEFHAMGVELAGRGARADEYPEAMLALWDEPIPEFAGEHVSFSGVMSRPLPAQRPHPPDGDVDRDRVRAYADAGVHRLILQPAASIGDAADELIAYASDELIGAKYR